MSRPGVAPAVLAILVAGLVGCGPVTVPVSGTVNKGDGPIAGATVSFLPEPGQADLVAATGTTEAAGRFTLKTPDGGDPRPGRYKVLVTKMVLRTAVVSDASGLEGDAPLSANRGVDYRSEFDPAWSTLGTTPLSLEIVPGMKPLTIDMADPAKTVVATGP